MYAPADLKDDMNASLKEATGKDFVTHSSLGLYSASGPRVEQKPHIKISCTHQQAITFKSFLLWRDFSTDDFHETFIDNAPDTSGKLVIFLKNEDSAKHLKAVVSENAKLIASMLVKIDAPAKPAAEAVKKPSLSGETAAIGRMVEDLRAKVIAYVQAAKVANQRNRTAITVAGNYVGMQTTLLHDYVRLDVQPLRVGTDTAFNFISRRMAEAKKPKQQNTDAATEFWGCVVEYSVIPAATCSAFSDKFMDSLGVVLGGLANLGVGVGAGAGSAAFCAGAILLGKLAASHERNPLAQKILQVGPQLAVAGFFAGGGAGYWATSTLENYAVNHYQHEITNRQATPQPNHASIEVVRGNDRFVAQTGISFKQATL